MRFDGHWRSGISSTWKDLYFCDGSLSLNYFQVSELDKKSLEGELDEHRHFDRSIFQVEMRRVNSNSESKAKEENSQANCVM
jgi:hypothetical protein